jgi:mRNA interferase RelE/StbE
MYDVLISDRAEKQLRKLDRLVAERILAALERIRIRPESHVTKLVGDSGFKLRVGDYRILMDIDAGKFLILVIKVGHRSNIYKK